MGSKQKSGWRLNKGAEGDRRSSLTVLSALVLLFLLAGIGGTLCARAQEVQVPRLTQYVTDLTGTLTPQEIATISSELDKFGRATSTQIVVLMIPTVGEEPIEDLSYKIASANGIGVKGKNNGILLLIAKNDRKVRIEVGYGLEGALPDVLAWEIIRNEIAPQFRRGDYAGGIEAGVRAIMLATKNEYKADRQRHASPIGVAPLMIIIFSLFFFLKRFFKGGRRMIGGGFYVPPVWGGWGGRSSGGLGGGGFGGFSGGGGSFGGGGASGGW